MDKLQKNNIVNEVSDSFLEYSMSVIVSRALPDLRDGLKPVHRRILYSMYESGYTPDKPHKKSARIVGDVMGKYHPHGDSSIYEAMVRMAQDFSYRNMLVDGHGNFGNIEGYGAAAMRYTESRLSKISLELLKNIRKDTVDFVSNFDESEREPVILPSRFPNILTNGTMGIAVGMATNIPPHNLGEVIDGTIAYIENNNITTEELMEYIKGPDFPTGANILGNSGIKKAYETGRGSITIRSKARIEEEKGRNYIIIDEVPYGINTHDLKNKVAELVNNKVIDGISDYHTDLKNGIKITITLKKDANAQVVLNNLYKHTAFQTNFGIILLMLDQGVPKVLGLKEIISKYVDYQKEVIIRRTRFDLGKAEDRAHILEGLKIALDHIDAIIKLIKESKNESTALTSLIEIYKLSEIQAQAILDMRLRRLTGLEREKIEEELVELNKLIEELKKILNSEELVLNIIKEEMTEIKDKYADDRRTNIDMTAIEYIEDESLIPVEDIVITLTNNGYIKRLKTNTYKTQNRGGVGVKGMSTNETDYVEHLIPMKTHDYLLMFSNKGKVYRVKGYEIPEMSRQSKGLPIVNLLSLEKNENISSIINIEDKENEDELLIFATKNGLVKRTSLSNFENIRKTGKIAILLKENDELISVNKTTGTDEFVIGTSNGRMVRFNEQEIRVMGRNTAGVKGVNLENAVVVGAEIVKKDQQILIVTEKGYGKRTDLEEYRLTHRGSKGVKALNLTDKNGMMVALKCIDTDIHNQLEVIIITNNGTIIKLPLNQISKLKRATQGVRLINLKAEHKISTIAVVEKEIETESEQETENKKEIAE